MSNFYIQYIPALKEKIEGWNLNFTSGCKGTSVLYFSSNFLYCCFNLIFIFYYFLLSIRFANKVNGYFQGLELSCIQVFMTCRFVPVTENKPLQFKAHHLLFLLMTIQKTATIKAKPETPTATAGHLSLVEWEGVPDGDDVPMKKLKLIMITVICP